MSICGSLEDWGWAFATWELRMSNEHLRILAQLELKLLKGTYYLLQHGRNFKWGNHWKITLDNVMNNEPQWRVSRQSIKLRCHNASIWSRGPFTHSLPIGCIQQHTTRTSRQSCHIWVLSCWWYLWEQTNILTGMCPSNTRLCESLMWMVVDCMLTQWGKLFRWQSSQRVACSYP